MSNILNNRIIVTGGSRGIGKVLVRALAEQGAAVISADLDDLAGVPAVLRHVADGLNVKFFKTDVSQMSQIKNLVSYAKEKLGGIDTIINNARPRVAASDPENFLSGWDACMDIFLKGSAYLVNESLPHLKESENPSIINMSSTNAHLICSQPLSYHVAKSGIEQMTRYFAYFLGKYSIRANSISPGIVDLYDENRPTLTLDPLNMSATQKSVPLRRACSPVEVGDAVSFLISPGAKYITGENIRIDGGLSIGDQFHTAREALRGI